MATIYKEILIDAPAEDVWDALRDFGALHERLVPGFVVATDVHDQVRVVTFFNGSVAQERLVGTDDDARRLAYTVIDGPIRCDAPPRVGAGHRRRGRPEPVRLGDRRAARRARSADERPHGPGARGHQGDARTVKTVAVPDLFTIGEFSRTTHLSVKALRHYHDVGLLEPDARSTR